MNEVTVRSGTPRFCSAGCAEIVYISSIMETLFRSQYRDFTGEQPEEGIIASGFTLDPNLAWMDFDIRQGIQFHGGYGELTAEDVVFSFNDANSNTQPDSVHGQAGDFSPLIERLEILDTYKVRMVYRNYDSRGIRHRFSLFWQTAGVTSQAVFEQHGPEAMRDIIIGTGPYELDDWVQGDRITMHAVENHWRHTASVARITYLQIGEPGNRAALLRTGQVIMSQPSLSDWSALVAEGFVLNEDSGNGNIRNIGMTGNYWEKTRYYDDQPLERQIADKPWVSGSPEDDPDRYERARKVRLALAHTIDREGIFDTIMGGFGLGPMYFAYQPPPDHPGYHSGEYVDKSEGGEGGQGGWEYPYDPDLAAKWLEDAGYRDGFRMENVWTGPPGLPVELMTAIGGTWAAELGVDVTLNNAVYATYRPGLVSRTTSEPFIGCGDDANTGMPYDWARGFVMSSWSDGGYGVGMEIRYAAENYAQVAKETDRERRIEMNLAFSEKGIEDALCIGIVHEPVYTAQNPNLVAEYRKLPIVEGGLSTLNNPESIVLK